ncbi:related to integral membrane protein pth11 [Phialocephala subalpina]|uniref:Related to integral membrane protein pth11 n=1 Tax=Phialocephala subalpina TaxID=576137 RepID=A0A1L7XLB1_9HELO|nr:related to integral membrane protein pth11 [Phialocephala subalpina]
MANSEYNGDQLVAVAALFLSLTYISVLLRCYVRARITKCFQLDDWLMVISQVIFTLSCSFILRGVHYGMGRHNSTLSQENQIQSLKYQAFATLSYVANMMFIKLSIAIFLLRIAVERPYIWILRISMIVVAVWSVAIFIYDLFQCIPVAAQWDTTIKNAKCDSGGSFAAAAYSISVMTIVTDWLYALLPIPMIWSVQMSVQAKATVVFVLSLGVFASIATLIRLKYIVELTVISDVLCTTAMVWTLVEPGVAITAASLITIRPLLRSFNLAGFESDPSHNCYTDSRHTHISLRNDIPDENWNTSTVSSGGIELNKVSTKSPVERLKGSINQVRHVGSMEIRDADAGSEEYILEGNDEGIRRTVHVRVEHDRASKMGTPNG